LWLIPKWLLKTIVALVPAVTAYVAVALEFTLRRWAHGRAAALPLIMLFIGTALLNPRLRHQLIIALCYGVAFLALRDISATRTWTLPFPVDPNLANAAVFSALFLISVLSGVAAISETFNPGTVWARRCYFGAAALYCGGLGVSCFGPHGSAQSIVLIGTGITAIAGCLFTDRIVGSEGVEPTRPTITDEASQRLRDAQHLRALRDREWRDPEPADTRLGA